MANEWGETQLSRIAKLRSGFPFKSSSWVDDGVPVIKIANVKDGRIVADGCGYVSHETAATAREWMTQKGDVLIAMTGYVGEIARVRSGEKYLINQRVGRFDFLDDSPVIPEFFFYYLRQSEVRSLLETMARGSAQPNLSASDAAKLWVPVPPPAEQRAIAHILGKLDEKIELNRKQNKTLEAMARTLFKAWFVDFEPVCAKMEGRWQRGESLPGLPARLYDLFPDRLVDSELGEIPEGWRCGELSDLATYLNGYAFKTKDWAESGHPVVKIGNVKPGLIDVSGATCVSPDIVVGLGRFKLSRGDLLIGMTGYVGETGLVPTIEPPAYLNQRVGKISTKCGVADLGFVYCLVRNPDYKTYAELKSHGSAQANVSGSDLMAYPCVLPETLVLDVFNEMLYPMLRDILENHDESRSLAQLRDTLLHELISGELLIPDAERILGGLIR